MVYKTLKEVSKNSKGYYGIGASSCGFNKNFPQYLRITDISDDGRVPKILPSSINTNEYPEYKNYYLQNGDLLLARTGNSTGRNHLYKGTSNSTVFAGFLIKFSIDKNLIEPNYVGYYCQSREYYNQIESLITGSTRPNINAEQYGDLLIPIVDSPTQQHIVDTIGSVDNLIEKNEEIIEKIKQYRQTYFNNFYNMYKNNSEISLIDIVIIEGGSQPPKSEHIYEYKKGYVRFIQNRDYNSSSHITYIKESSKNKICNKYDIMIDKYGEAGTIRYGLEGAYNVALSKITITKEYYTEFVRNFLMQKKIKELLNNSCQASTRASLNESTFIGIKIPNIPAKLIKKYEEDMKTLLITELKIIDKNKELALIKNNLLSKYFD